MLIDEVADAVRADAELRRQPARQRGQRARTRRRRVADFGADSSYLDIPAFLRRQAD